ncbi:hypothetical protein Dacet_1952 [Denitrovibrio acetiphilus DSM 12809]|uniref:Tetrahaem cytochrome domain-containing protein n=1 Tax=Denitrovibrio acetiphilus (strain DSM 12809 / NBRC 114555 / N2460) TaxID=522772 RepID=D4H152_DENA2|nr:cytochrome c3 family protein [Denitrovibrio acetiphilus]ADD68715.1 hypothetical protein Dacet_1952 [Denitrovibrio acetiphilus DSM 12809]
MRLTKVFIVMSSVTLLALLLTSAAIASPKNKNLEDPEYCKTCHVIEPYYNSLYSGDLLAQAHGDAGLTCADCHEEYIANGVSKKDSSSKLRKRDFGDDFCLRCHDKEEVDKEVVFPFGKGKVRPHSQHVGELNCSTCHSMHSKSDLLCAKCHVQPWMKTLPKRWSEPVKTEQ